MERVTASIESADPGLDSHLISTWSYHTMQIHTLSFPTCDLTCSVWDFLEACNSVDSQCPVVSYLLTGYLRSVSWILFGCRPRWGRVWMVGSLPSSSIISPQQPPSGVSLSSLNEHVLVLLQLYWSTICSQIECIYICWETWMMHAVLWCRESCGCNKDEYDKTKCLVVM